MSSPSQPKDIFNCIKAPFDLVDTGTPGEWFICYNQQQNKLLLSVQLNQPDQLKQGSALLSTLDASALSELFEFLASVKMRMAKLD